MRGAAASDVYTSQPWWRVVDASGRPPRALRAEALARLRAEDCPLTSLGDDARVVLRVAVWWPEDQP